MPKYTAAQKRAYAARMRKKKNGKIKKKPLVKARAALVEVKKRDATEIALKNINPDGTEGNHYPVHSLRHTIPNNDAVFVFDLPAWNRQSHGFEDHNCVGNSIFMKWLDFRVQFDFPTGTDAIVNPIRLYLVHGWLKKVIGATDNTTPNRGAVTQTAMRTNLYTQLAEYFDEKTDFLIPRDLGASNIKINGYKRIAPDRNQNIAGGAGWYNPSYINRKIKFTLNRKMELTEGLAEATNYPAATHDTQNLYINNSWQPFVLLYSPDFNTMRNAAGADVSMGVRYNSTLYFTDS